MTALSKFLRSSPSATYLVLACARGLQRHSRNERNFYLKTLFVVRCAASNLGHCGLLVRLSPVEWAEALSEAIEAVEALKL